MARNFSNYKGGVLVTGGIEPAGNFPVVESKYVMVDENGRTLSDVLGTNTNSIASQISDALVPYSTTSQVKAFNDMANYYTRTQLDTTANTAKINKSSIVTNINDFASSSDTQVPSAKLTYTAIEAAKTTAANNKTPNVTSGSAVPVTSGGVYSELHNNYYTKTEAETAFYVAISVSISLNVTTLEQYTSNNSITVSWKTNTVPRSVKINNTEAGTAGSYTAVTGSKSISIDTTSTGNKSVTVLVAPRKTDGDTASASANVVVCNKVYYGFKIDGTHNSSFITELPEKSLRNNAYITNNGSIAKDQYFWIAFPSDYSVPGKFTVNGYATSFTEIPGTIPVSVNKHDVTYKLYRSPIKATSSATYNVTTSAS